MSLKKDVLIAYIPTAGDLKIAHKKKWYRIPANRKIVPRMVKNNSIQLIAFYQPAVFKTDAFAVRYYAKVKGIELVERKKLFPDEPLNEHSNNLYYKINIEKLLRLPKAIKSLRHRRILFITTTVKKFEQAKEINDLFYGTSIEEKLWKALTVNKIRPERQFLESVNNNNFYLDFALFCKKSKIAIECDGDKYHLKEKAVRRDKKRDNLLESKGWNVFRYTTYDITKELNTTVEQIKDIINYYGGVEDTKNSKFVYYPDDDVSASLFKDINY